MSITKDAHAQCAKENQEFVNVSIHRPGDIHYLSIKQIHFPSQKQQTINYEGFSLSSLFISLYPILPE